MEAVRAWRCPVHDRVDHARLHGKRASAHLTDALRDAVREHPGVEVHRRPAEGPAHRILLDASARADLIVVGALRRHGHFGPRLGRGAHTLPHHSDCPVVAVNRQRARNPVTPALTPRAPAPSPGHPEPSAVPRR
ncbi:universal stress protein [Streptomyces sp. KM273126]|nr:universal stress protein [Streptomyces sp. KM273126]